MAELPTFHAHQIDVHLTANGAKAVLTAAHLQDGLTATLPVEALLLSKARFRRRWSPDRSNLRPTWLRRAKARKNAWQTSTHLLVTLSVERGW
jgi:hypothetical protein